MNYFSTKFQNIIVKSFPIVFVLLGLTLPVLAGWLQKQKITSTPRGVGAQFGFAVAINGNTMVVGARHDSMTASNKGAAFVYVRSGNIWTQQAQLVASDGAAADEFGYSVAISENTIVVGAYHADAPLSNGGAAYVFVRSGTTWTQQQKLTAADGTADDEFGNAVAITGEVIVVGAHHADLPGNSSAGAAYIFLRTGTIWAQTQRLNPSLDVVLGDIFGDSVAISANKIAVGASGDDTPSTSAGAVYVFVETGTATYSLQQKLTIPDGTNGDQFGFSVALEGNTLVGGAAEDTTIAGQVAIGAAYAFEFNGSTWQSQGKLLASDGAAFDRFGWSVGVSNNVITVGARGDTTTAGSEAGSAYIFTRSGTTWTQQQKLTPSDPLNSDRFGASIALSFGNLLIGAAEKQLTSPNGQGAVYYFNQQPSSLFDFDGDGRADVSVFRPSTGTWYLQQSTNGFSGAAFGASTDKIVPADYDGDGKTDLAVYRGGIWYLLRSTLGFTGVTFGTSNDVPHPADYDGDGKADVAVYRPSDGIWYVLNSSNGSFTGVAFGTSTDQPVAADYDGDGKADVAVYRPSTGTWYVLRSTQGITAVQFGISTDKPVASDYDGDGKADFAVFRNGTWYLLQSTAGFTGVLFGTATDLPTPADYDGDGKTDVAVFRNGTWYLLQSTQGVTTTAFGAANDKPIPNAYVP